MEEKEHPAYPSKKVKYKKPKNTFGILLSLIGKVAASITLIAMAFLFIYAGFKMNWLPFGVVSIIAQIVDYAIIGVLSIVALSFCSRGFFRFIGMSLIVAVVVIFSFFPSVRDSLIGLIIR
jgi:hypothetical protein